MQEPVGSGGTYPDVAGGGEEDGGGCGERGAVLGIVRELAYSAAPDRARRHRAAGVFLNYYYAVRAGAARGASVSSITATTIPPTDRTGPCSGIAKPEARHTTAACIHCLIVSTKTTWNIYVAP